MNTTTKRSKVYPTHAPGPRDCMRSLAVHADCDKCGKRPDVLHMPMRLHGWYCSEHCPCCSPAVKELGPIRWRPNIDLDAEMLRVKD